MSGRGRFTLLEQQVAMLERAATFLANNLSRSEGEAFPSDAQMARNMPHRVMGNGLRELDIFLTDIIAEARRLGVPVRGPRHVPPANDPYHHRRVYCAAEAYRRVAGRLGWQADHYPNLKSVRAAQNRMAFGWRRRRHAPAVVPVPIAEPFGLAGACAFYVSAARDILGAAYDRGR
ncbi:hypothetical protein BH10PSE12_BH10PSE12_26580 [soil metagenome]